MVPATGKVIYATTGDVTLKRSSPIARLVPFIEQALSIPGTAHAYINDRLRLAFDLWADYHREQRLRAKFLTLVMALEALAETIPKHPAAVALLDRWAKEATTELSNWAPDTEEYEAIESVRRELLVRRHRSIRSRIQSHITGVIDAVQPGEGTRIAKLARTAYDHRSTLLHTGAISSAALSEGHTVALTALRATLLASLGVSPLTIAC